MNDAKLIVTVDIFSGRKNPVVEFTGAELAAVAKQLAPVRQVKAGETGMPPIPTLGYRGLLVEQVGAPLKGLPDTFRVAAGIASGRGVSSVIADEGFEAFVLSKLPDTLPVELFKQELERFRQRGKFWADWQKSRAAIPHPPKQKCKFSPIYEPDWWNVPEIQPHNNCYNYASNYRTDTFAQPGQAAGAMYQQINCKEVKAGAIADALVNLPHADNVCLPDGHLVVLVIWPDTDFHWYRRGKNGRWSHKPGGTPVTDRDNSGNLIFDPREADRGGYTQFCTFMQVRHGHIKIA